MVKNHLEQLDFTQITSEAPYMIKNFILSNNRDADKIININLEAPFTFNGLVFAICLKGNGRIKIDFKEYYTEENSLLIILPNQIAENIEHSEDFFIEIFALSLDFLSEIPISKDFDLPHRIARNPVLNLSEKDKENILRYHSFIIDTFSNDRSFLFEQIIQSLLHALLMEVVIIYSNRESKLNQEKVSSRSEDIVEQFLKLLKDHYKEGRSASFYSEKMFITPKYLSSTLKRVTGRSINFWIEDAVILGAKILLKSTTLTAQQISDELNFPNSSYFGRFFKKHTGMTPKSYREN